MGSEINPREPTRATALALSAQGRCPACRYQIYIQEGATYTVIKAAVIKAEVMANHVYGKCPKCKNWLIMPLRYVAGPERREDERG